jgi:hypothetical protein
VPDAPRENSRFSACATGITRARSQVSGHEFTHAVQRKEKNNSLLPQAVAQRSRATSYLITPGRNRSFCAFRRLGSYQGTGFSRAVRGKKDSASAAGFFLFAQIGRAVRIIFRSRGQSLLDRIVVNIFLVRDKTLLVGYAHLGFHVCTPVLSHSEMKIRP